MRAIRSCVYWHNTHKNTQYDREEKFKSIAFRFSFVLCGYRKISHALSFHLSRLSLNQSSRDCLSTRRRSTHLYNYVCRVLCCKIIFLSTCVRVGAGMFMFVLLWLINYANTVIRNRRPTLARFLCVFCWPFWLSLSKHQQWADSAIVDCEVYFSYDNETAGNILYIFFIQCTFVMVSLLRIGLTWKWKRIYLYGNDFDIHRNCSCIVVRCVIQFTYKCAFHSIHSRL